jgi:hypothetical protein
LLALPRDELCSLTPAKAKPFMDRVGKSFSLWAFIAFLLLFLLQVFPFPGLYLMFIGGALLCGIALHAALLGIAVEALLGRLPRVLIIIPLAAYGGYYLIYWKQGRDIALEAERLQASNRAFVRTLDFSVNSLVAPFGTAELLASRYEVPVAYDANSFIKPEGYISHRLLDAEQCSRVRDAQAQLREQRASPPTLLFKPVRLGSEGPVLKDVCVFNFPEAPPFDPIVVTYRNHTDDSEPRRGITEHFVDFSFAGHVFATYATASVWRLPRLPILVIGCFLNDKNPSWDCGAEFARRYEAVDSTPVGVDKAVYDIPESIVLGLRKRTASSYTNFKGDSRWSSVIDRVANYPAEQARNKLEVSASLFSQFSQFVHDRDVEASKEQTSPPSGMDSAILANPEQLVPLRDDLFSRLIELLKVDDGFIMNKWTPLLLKSLAALPRESFDATPDDKVIDILGLLEKRLPYPFCATSLPQDQNQSYTTIADLLKMPPTARQLRLNCLHLAIQLL